MTQVVVLLALALVAYAAARLVKSAVKEGPRQRHGWLDDDGVARGERWDGSWLSGPRTALSLG